MFRIARSTLALVSLAAPFLLLPVLAMAETPGLSASEVVLGTHQDLSGPIVSWGVPTRNGLEMAFAEANAKGGVHGRKIKLIVEDSGYDPKKAVLATNKLLTRDNVFAMIGMLGSPTTLAAMPRVLDKGRLHLFPVTSAIETYEPFHKLKFAAFIPYQHSIAIGVRHAIDTRGAKKVAILYQDDDFGRSVRDGVHIVMKERGLTVADETTYKRGATDFATQIAKLRSSGADLVVLGTIVRETVGAVQAARALGWNVQFLCSQACYTPETVDIGGKTVEGLLAMGQTPVPYPDDPNPKIRDWVERYETTYNAKASAQALTAYTIGRLFLAALEAAGKDLTVEGYAKALEDLPPWVDPDIGGVPTDFTATQHLGVDEAFIAEVKAGRWVTVVPATRFEAKP